MNAGSDPLIPKSRTRIHIGDITVVRIRGFTWPGDFMDELQIHVRDNFIIDFRNPNIPIPAFKRLNQKLAANSVKLLKASLAFSIILHRKVPAHLHKLIDIV